MTAGSSLSNEATEVGFFIQSPFSIPSFFQLFLAVGNRHTRQEANPSSRFDTLCHLWRHARSRGPEKEPGGTNKALFHYAMNKSLKSKSRRPLYTLGDLIVAVSASSQNSREAAVVIADLLESGQVTFLGNRRRVRQSSL
jgi:hypothetical protein